MLMSQENSDTIIHSLTEKFGEVETRVREMGSGVAGC